MEGRQNRLPNCGCWHARAERHRFHAQQGPDGGGLVFLQAPSAGLAFGGAVLRREALGFRIGQQRRGLAVGFRLWVRCSSLLPGVQPHLTASKVRYTDGLREKWVPEFGTDAYPEPIVEHKFARQRAIDTYKAALA